MGVKIELTSWSISKRRGKHKRQSRFLNFVGFGSVSVIGRVPAEQGGAVRAGRLLELAERCPQFKVATHSWRTRCVITGPILMA